MNPYQRLVLRALAILIQKWCDTNDGRLWLRDYEKWEKTGKYDKSCGS